MNMTHTAQHNTPITNWDEYAQSFQSVMPSEMINLNKEVARYMHGRVADFGCGAGKIIPFIVQKENVETYIGIDSSAEMIARARWMAAQFTDSKATLIHASIESAQLDPVDTALSINSHYTWPDPFQTLKAIFQHIKPGGQFVLATINSSIDMPALLDAASAEMIAHPHWEAFKAHNLGIASHQDINLMNLDTLIEQVRQVGFQIEEAHRRWYAQGLNTLVLIRPQDDH